MWQMNNYWFDFAMVSMMYALGNILMGHFEEHTPKWRRVLKYLLTLVVIIALVHYTNRCVAYGMIALLFVFVLYVHIIVLPGKGINGWTGEPKSKYYALRKWDKSLFTKGWE